MISRLRGADFNIIWLEMPARANNRDRVMHASRFIVLYHGGIRHKVERGRGGRREKKKKGSFVKAASGNQD